MTYYKKKDYNLLGFEGSHLKEKKYNAILYNKKSGRIVRVPFGAKKYEHYKDSTGLMLYSYLDHRDKKRRKNFMARHSGFVKSGYYSPSYFSVRYLW
jgi:hypothetical protein